MKEIIEVKAITITVKALTHKQLAQMYGVSWSTFRNWMKKVEHEVGKKTGHLLPCSPLPVTGIEQEGHHSLAEFFPNIVQR